MSQLLVLRVTNANKKKHCRIWKNNKNNQKSALWSERRILSKKKLFYEVNSLGGIKLQSWLTLKPWIEVCLQ